MTIQGAQPVTLVGLDGATYSAGAPGPGSTMIQGARPVVLVDPSGNTYSAITQAGLAATAAPTSLLAAGSRWVALGDSQTLGGDIVSNPTRAAASWTTHAGLASDERWHLVRNAGVAGNTTAMMLARFDTDVTPFNPGVVTLLAGRNDISTVVSAATYQANIATLIGKIRTIGAVPILATIPPTIGTDGQTTRDWNNWLRGYAARNRIKIVDFYDVLTDPATGSYLAAYDSGDHVHPNEAGYAAMAARFVSDMASMASPRAIPRLYDSADTSNLEPNPLFLSTTISSNTPAGWVLNGNSGVVGSIMTGDTAIRGNWYRLTCSATAADNTLTKGLTAVAGHVYAFTGRIRTSLTASGGVYVQAGKGVGTAYALSGLGVTPVDGRFWVAFTAASTAISGQVLIKAGATGTIDVAEVAMYDLTALGIDGLVA